MTREDLLKVQTSLLECVPDIEKLQWGPSHDFALQRRKEALQLLQKALSVATRRPLLPSAKV